MESVSNLPDSSKVIVFDKFSNLVLGFLHIDLNKVISHSLHVLSIFLDIDKFLVATLYRR